MSKPSPGNWKRFLALGCSHGHLEDPEAIRAVLKFRRAWKPHRVVHLGDFTDTAAFRSGALGSSDEAVDLKADLGHGLNFLRALEPTDVLIGNHEVRLYDAAQHYNAIKAYAAQAMIDEIRDEMRKLHCSYTEHWQSVRSWITLGDTKLLHGFVYGENATRDHAEHYGKCIHAHNHTPAQVIGRRSDNPLGTAVGTLMSIQKAGYANSRRATARWAPGFAWGEFQDREDGQCNVRLSQCAPGQAGQWVLPV